MSQHKIQRPAIEYNLTEHCNLRCAGCDHASPHLPRMFADIESFQRDLLALAQVCHFDELRLLGGEPLLHPRLVEFLEFASQSGVSDTITVVTNGVLLHTVDDEVFRLIDTLRVSLYPGVTVRADMDELRRLGVELGFTLSVKRISKFRQTLINSPHKSPDVVKEVYQHCGLTHTWCCHTVHDGRYYKCPQAHLLGTRMALTGVAIENRQVDGVPIHGNPRLREELIEYLLSDKPLDACSYCLGTSGREFPHHLLDKKGVRQEIVADHSRPEQLIDRDPIRATRRWIARRSHQWLASLAKRWA